MTPKARRSRQKNRVATEAKVLEAARGTRPSGFQKPLLYQWNDGCLVHRVAVDRRSFYVNIDSHNRWQSRQVWATFCGYVIAIDLTKVWSTGRAPTCVRCVAGSERFDGLVILPWDGRLPHVM